MRRCAFLLALGLALPAGLAMPCAAAPAANALPAGISAGPTLEGISEYRLDNGLRVLLFPDAATPTTLVNVTYSVGSAQENYGESGMAHLLEHLLFKGTPKVANIAEEFKKRGIYYNGTTARERTNYYGWFPPDEKTLDWLLAVEADRMVNANVAKSELDSEMTVVRNELEIGENKPERVLTQRLTSQAYLWHAYRKSVIGNRSDVENVPIERLQAFYRTWYQPDNATVIVAGRFDPDQTLKTIQRYFGAIPRPARTLPARYTVEPAQDGEREINVRRTGELDMIALGYHGPAITHPDSAALDVLDSVMGSVPSGRLHKALVAQRLASNADSGSESALDPGLVTFFAVPAPGVAPARLERALLDQVEGAARTPFTEEEVAAAKQRLDNIYERARNNVIGTANALSDAIAAGDWRLWFLSRHALSKVTAADVNRVAATYLVPSNRTLARFIPTPNPVRVEIAQAPGVQALLKDYVGQPPIASGEVFDSSPRNIAARTEFVTLGDGLKVALLPKQSRGDIVNVSIMFHFGDDVSTAGRTTAGDFAGSMLMYGSKTMSREQIARRFDELQARVSVTGGSQLGIISLRVSRRNLVPALRLAADVMRNPAYPEAEFEQLRMQSITGLEVDRGQPGSIVDLAMRKHFDPWPAGHPEAVRSVEERLADLKSLKLEDVRAFHREFYGTAQGEAVLVGDFDPAQVKQELTTLFAGWKSPHPYVLKPEPFYQPGEVVHRSFETPDKANAVVVSRSSFELGVDDPDHPALLVAARIFGNGAKASRLGDRVREKEGLSYYVGGGVLVDPVSGNGTFYMQATSAPENMARVETAMREELARFVRDGITARELEDAKAGLLTVYKDNRSDDTSIAGKLRMDLFLGRSQQWTEDFEAAIAGLTLEQVNAAIARRIRPDQVSTFVAGDFAAGERRLAAAKARPGDGKP
ncbi:MAG: pitrilysin family protein [Pseudomonas sp.]